MKASNSRRITAEERDELRDAILHGRIANATAFAEAYGSEHGLNPSTVRTTISRLRHELGVQERPARDAGGSISARGSGRSGWFARVLLAAPEDEVGRVGAAALVRYKADARFKSAVDEHTAEVEQTYAALKVLLKNVPESARPELMHAYLESGSLDSSAE